MDICDSHKVASSEPLRSVWIVVDAIHKASQLKIVFPATHDEQLGKSASKKIDAPYSLPVSVMTNGKKLVD